MLRYLNELYSSLESSLFKVLNQYLRFSAFHTSQRLEAQGHNKLKSESS